MASFRFTSQRVLETPIALLHYQPSVLTFVQEMGRAKPQLDSRPILEAWKLSPRLLPWERTRKRSIRYSRVRSSGLRGLAVRMPLRGS